MAGQPPSTSDATAAVMEAHIRMGMLHDRVGTVNFWLQHAICGGQAASEAVQNVFCRLDTILDTLDGCIDALTPEVPDDRGQRGPTPGSQLTLC